MGGGTLVARGGIGFSSLYLLGGELTTAAHVEAHLVSGSYIYRV